MCRKCVAAAVHDTSADQLVVRLAGNTVDRGSGRKMSQYQFLDELVREYLLFRGFPLALKAFDAELKVEKEKGFRVDR